MPGPPGLPLAPRLLSLVVFMGLALQASAGFAQAAMALPEARVQAAPLTNVLLQLLDRHRQAAPAESARLLPELAGVAARRRQALAALVETDPAEILKLSLPADVWSRLPPEARTQAEIPVDIQGELVVIYEDQREQARLRHVLRAGGRRYSLHFAGGPPDLLSGTQVSVRALQLGNALVLEPGGTATRLQVTAPPPPVTTFGNLQAAVFLVNFQGNAAQPFSASQAWDIFFSTGTNSVSDYFREASFQQASLSGDIHGWYTLPIAATCEGHQIAAATRTVAAAAGVDLAAYQRFVYVFPANPGCGWSGRATVGGTPASAWINGTLADARPAIHLLGHNFGLYHSKAIECGAAAVGGSCQVREYGDWLDAMGNRNGGHYNAFQKERLGWLNYGGSPPIATTETGGGFALEAYGSVSSGAKALKVLRSVDPASGRRSWYYLEYRRPLGFDAFLSSNGAVPNGILIRRASDGQPGSSQLVDATPGSASDEAQDWGDAALPAGMSFTDPGAGLVITATSAGGPAAGVSVSYEVPACLTVAPGLLITPGQGVPVAPGGSAAYTVTVTNNDSPVCGTTQFDLEDTVPAGWAGRLETSSLAIAPGAKASTTLTLTSPASVPAGIYRLGVRIGEGPAATAAFVVQTGVPSQP